MKRYFSFSAMAFIALGLLFFVSCNSNMQMEESSPETQALKFKITLDDPYDTDENGVITVRKQMTDMHGAAIGAELVFAYPDLKTFGEEIGNEGKVYDMDQFVFIADYSDPVQGDDPEIEATSLRNVVAAVEGGEITRSLGYFGVYGRGVPKIEGAEYPQVDLHSVQTATEYGLPTKDEWTDSNCPLLIGCSGDCAFTQITANGTWLYTGDCRRAGASSLWVCYCHTTRAVFVPNEVGIGSN